LANFSAPVAAGLEKRRGGKLRFFDTKGGHDKMELEEKLICAYLDNPWANAEAIPDYSTAELLTAALAVQRYDLIPYHWKDPLFAYHKVLNSRQRSIVDRFRGW